MNKGLRPGPAEKMYHGIMEPLLRTVLWLLCYPRAGLVDVVVRFVRVQSQRLVIGAFTEALKIRADTVISQ